MKCPAYKIASPEINHIPLIERVAKTNKPILSLGLANKKDIDLAILIKRNGNTKIILLKCVSVYPALTSEQNVSAIKELKNIKFHVVYQTILGYIAPVTAAVLGAKLIEKHFNINNNKSVDSFFSTNENEFKNMVDQIRLAESSLGDGRIEISKNSKKNYNSRRSIYVSKNIKKGETITDENIKIVRPNYGLHPKYYKFVINKISTTNLKIGDRFKIKYVKK